MSKTKSEVGKDGATYWRACAPVSQSTRMVGNNLSCPAF